MKKLTILAALLMASTSAYAGSSFSFRVNGQSVRIDVPRNCSALSCISVTAPGLKFSDPEDEPERTSPQTSTSSLRAPTWNARPADLPAAPAAPAATAALAERAGTPAVTPAISEATPSRQPEPQPKPSETTVVAAAPAQGQVQAPAAAPQTPLGTWMTEKKEGLVRIEPCGANLCGYTVNAKTNLNGEKVLIDMKPTGDKWKGRIKDTRNGGGGVYDSTMALKSTDSLRVQGCAFGGMFCGGQTWTRVN